jgi:uncharacterized protein YvpB
VKRWYSSIFLAFVVATVSVIISLILPNYSFLSPNPANAQQVDVRNGYAWLTLPRTGNQDDSWSCGPNSAARVLAFYGNQVDYGTVRSVAQRDHGIIPTKVCIGSGILKTCANTSSFKTGLEPSEIRDVMNRWEGGNTKYVSGANLDQLKSLLSQGKPVLVLRRVGSFKPGKVFGTWPEMHWVAVHGFNDQEQKIYYTDTDGGTYQKPYSEFLSEWDWRIGDGLASETFYQKDIRPKTMIWVDRSTGGSISSITPPAASNYRNFQLKTGTALEQTGDNWNFGVLPNGDLVGIKKSGTGSGKTEVHILTAASNYRSFRLQTGTALHETGDNFAFSVLPNGDLVAIKKSGTGSGKTEVHILAAQ